MVTIEAINHNLSTDPSDRIGSMLKLVPSIGSLATADTELSTLTKSETNPSMFIDNVSECLNKPFPFDMSPHELDEWQGSGKTPSRFNKRSVLDHRSDFHFDMLVVPVSDD